MQKIAQNVGTSIDSLNAKILLMQNELSSLKVQNKGISDSLKTLNETLTDAKIKTSFFTDQLAFQLFCFSIILVVIGLFSWKWIITPLETKINEILTNNIPDLEKSVNEKLSEEISKIEKQSIDIRKQAINGHAWALKALQLQTLGNKDYKASLMFCLRELRIAALHVEITNQNEGRIKQTIDNSFKLIRTHNITINKYTEDYQTQINEIAFDLKNSKKEILKEFWYDFKKEFLINPSEKNTEVNDVENPKNFE
ncbi:hypothetical protein [Sphingobacterium kyonggiense]